MKVRKKTALLVSFTLGALLLATTAMADLANKSGYDRLKDSLKVTAEQCSEKYDTFTMDHAMELKVDGKTVASENTVTKYDRIQQASENNTMSENPQEKYSYYHYGDPKTEISLRDGDSTYYVTEYDNRVMRGDLISNPFKEDEAEDLEKIADALVGNLKDHVIATENADGSFDIEGRLNEVQIPALVNAVVSFAIKQDMQYEDGNIPRLTKDVFVKEITGTAKVNQDGVMESLLGGAVLTGTDAQGTVHDMSLELLFKLTDINTTTVAKPDLTGKTVVVQSGEYEDGILNPEKFVGTFKNSILIEKDGKYVKIGERILVIEQADEKAVAGHYAEEFKPEFAEYATDGERQKFTFTAQNLSENGHMDYEFSTEFGDKGNMYFDEHGASIHFNLHTNSKDRFLFDSTFKPDLD